MSDSIRPVLLLGATGRTGSRVLEQLTRRGVPVRAIVRSAAKVPEALRQSPTVTLIEAEVLALDDAALREHVAGCGAVISCLGHVMTFRGVLGPPRDLVTRAVRRVRDAVIALAPATPVRFAVMTSVSVNRPGGQDTRRGGFDRAMLALLRVLIPPSKDNQRVADLLVATDAPCVEWVVVRPDALLDGDEGRYAVHEGIMTPLFRPDHTRMSNVAHFLCELATDDATWQRWRGSMPVIVDAPSDAAPADGTAPTAGSVAA